MKKIVLIVLSFFAIVELNAQTIKVLFDARKAQMAGNADWIVDSDLYNIGTGTGGAMTVGRGNEANPQRFPTPAQSGITSSTSETFWKGGLSAWGVACAKLGYQIETLPNNGTISYGNTSNVQDLSNYKVYIVCEPNIVFTAAEKTAILQFVQNGGGLFMIGNHNGSDRNSDTWDAPTVWNNLMSTNGIVSNPFGITFDLTNFSQTTTNFASLPTNTILRGSFGNPTRMKFSSGTSMTLDKTANSTVVGLVYKTGSTTTGTTGVMMASAKYGSGKVVGLGDSSCPDDGTGDTGDVLYNGWTGDVSGDHSRIIMNATIWLTNTAPRFGDELTETYVNIFPNPFSNELNIGFVNQQSEIITVNVFDLSGRLILTQNEFASEGINQITINSNDLTSGSYIVSFANSHGTTSKKVMKF